MEPKTDDPINPSHYKSGGIETIDVIEDFFANDYLGGSATKYTCRYEKKGGPEKRLEDAKKLRWFLVRITERDKAGGIMPRYGVSRFEVQEVVRAFKFTDSRMSGVLSALLAYGRHRIPEYAHTALRRVNDIILEDERAALKPDTIPPPSRDGFPSADVFTPPESKL